MAFGTARTPSTRLLPNADVKLKDARTEARVAEPDKCEEWRWCSREELAELPLFPPLRALLETDEGRHALNVVDFLG